ncbi:MAG: class I SAM-dependent methyltransferase [Treponema sp.]|nr:class I SAM-dependent methyltransferase [Treponema sp.]
MSSNEKLLIEKYSGLIEEQRGNASRAFALEFHYTKKVLNNYVDKNSTIIEVGCGTGYYGLYLSELCKEYTGVDLIKENIELFNSKISDNKILNCKALVGDATNLVNIDNEVFDLVLVSGPMYHLPGAERDLVFEEAKRICKKNGIIIFTYQNRLGVYLQACILSNPDEYPNETANNFFLEKSTSDKSPGLFFFTSPEEMKSQAKKHKLRILKNVGVKYYFNSKLIDNMDDPKYKCWMDFLDHLCESESGAGLSVQALLVCRREE